MLRCAIFLITFLVCNHSLLAADGAVTQSSSPTGFRWTSDDVIFHVHGLDSASYMGFGVNGLGDINGDSYDDFAVSYDLPGGQFNYGLFIYFGGNPPDSMPDIAYDNGVTLNPHMAHIDGDGIKDLVVGSERNVIGPAIGGIFVFRGYADSLASVPMDSVFPQSENFGFGYRLQTEMVDNDPYLDFLTCKLSVPFPDSTIVYYFSGLFNLDTIADWTYKVDQREFNLGDIGFVDYNGDGQKDIFVALRPNQDTMPNVMIFLGPSFNSSSDFVIGAPPPWGGFGPYYFANGVVNLGDIDNDSYDDLAIEYASAQYIYRCGPLADTVADYQLTNLHLIAARAGDINGDGQPDVVAGDNSAFGGVSAYLGGSEWDIFRDANLGRLDLPPLYLEQIGWRVGGAGDVNGDGFDDVVFACQNFAPGPNDKPGDVFIVKGGPHIVTGVNTDTHGPVTSFTLRQNYPNPFNPSTTISFDLPRKSRVTLTVVNILGQEIVRLVDKEMSAGTHSVEWDGRDVSGEPVASGVYLYRLTTDSGTLSRKMLLLK